MSHSREREVGDMGGSPVSRAGGGSASGEVDGRTFEFCVAAAATMANLLVAAGLSMVGLFQADLIAPDGTGPSAAALATAMHAAGPRLALACVCFFAVRAGSAAAITALGAVAGLLQGFDAITGAVQGDSLGTMIPAALAALQWWAIAVLDSRRPAGRTEAGDEGARKKAGCPACLARDRVAGSRHDDDRGDERWMKC